MHKSLILKKINYQTVLFLIFVLKMCQ